MADALTCANCAMWFGDETSFAAPCLLGVRARPAYDFTCDLHSGHNVVPAQPTVDMQSQVRGGPPWPNPGLAQWVKP